MQHAFPIVYKCGELTTTIRGVPFVFFFDFFNSVVSNSDHFLFFFSFDPSLNRFSPIDRDYMYIFHRFFVLFRSLSSAGEFMENWAVMTGMFLGRKRHRTLAERERKK
jgi:hypothetical protein